MGNSGEAGENPTKVPRKTLLQEINHFLHHMEWQQWKAQSNMYKDWFLPVVMGVDANTHAKGRPWSLYKRNGFAPARGDKKQLNYPYSHELKTIMHHLNRRNEV